MKVLILALATLALAQAEIDWSQVRHRDIDYATRTYVSHANGRIVGGNEVVPHSIPYQVGLMINTPQGTFFCGGSLISRNYVLTAAHCVDSVSNTGVEVVLGAHKIRDTTESGQVRIKSAQVTVHKKWDIKKLINDIALVKLSSPAPLSASIQTVALPNLSDDDFASQPCKITGWGRDSDSANGISPVLREVDTTVLTNSRCRTIYQGLQASNICSSGENKVGACNGDSGGPLVIKTEPKRVAGIVSYGLAIGCEFGFPSVFTRVTSFLDWIEENSDVKVSP